MNALLMIYLFSAVPAALFMIYALALSMSDTFEELFAKKPVGVPVQVPVINGSTSGNTSANAVRTLKRVA